MTERTELNPMVPGTSQQILSQGHPSSGHVLATAQLKATSAPVALAPISPEVFAYQDFRVYLTAWFQWKKQVQPHYSGAIFAKKAGFNSHTLLGMVIRGQRNLSATSIRAFCRALSLKGKEATYFEKLVLFNQARNSEDQAYYLEQLNQVSKVKTRAPIVWTQSSAEYLGHWYIPAMREMVALKGFRADPEWIATRLKKRITIKQATEAWTLLVAMGLVSQRETTGRWEIVHPMLEVDTAAIPGVLRDFNLECLELAKNGVAETSPSAQGGREVTTLALAIDRKDLRKLMDRIYDFRQQLYTEFAVPADREADQVVAVNTAVVTLSESEELPV